MAVTATGKRSGSPRYNFGTFNPLVSLAPEEENVPFTTAQRIAMGGSILSGGMAAGGQLAQGDALQKQSVYQAAQLTQNAELARRTAREIESAAGVAIQERSQETAQLIAMQKAQLAGAGIVVDQDTALSLIDDAVRLGTLDKLTMSKNAERQAMAARIQASQFEDQAALQLAAGKDAKSASKMASTSTLLGTAGTVAGKWYTYDIYNTQGIT